MIAAALMATALFQSPAAEAAPLAEQVEAARAHAAAMRAALDEAEGRVADREAALAVAAAESQVAEAEFLRARRRLADAEAQADTAEKNARATRHAAREALAALILTRRTPPAPAILGAPENAASAARVAIAAQAATERHKTTLREHQRAVTAAREALRSAEKERARLEDVRRRRAAKRRELEKLLADARDDAQSAEARLRRAEERADVAARAARDLADLSDRLLPSDRADRPWPRRRAVVDAERRFKGARPHLKPNAAVVRLTGLPDPPAPLHPPVIGRLGSAYGDQGGAGLPTRGITVTAASGAEVVAPADGEVVFASAYRGYGAVLILDLGGRDQAVLLGFERLYVAPGDRVRRGAPVGRLRRGPETPLYLELRRQRSPVDPKPWLWAFAPGVGG